MRAASSLPTRARRRALRHKIRVVGGALLLVSACLAGFSTMMLSPSSAAAASNHRELMESDTAHVQVHLHKTMEIGVRAIDNASVAAADADGDGSCGVVHDWERNGGIFAYIFGLLYLFVALAIVCDDYFVTSLERITDKLGLSSDVAGATFMAAGSSAPELFVSLADNVFTKPEGSMGVGTIVGSAIFNILIIISLSALLAGQELALDWRPMLRDSLWYCWAIAALAVGIWDGAVDVAESVLLVVSYLAYCMYMSQNERVVRAWCKRPDEGQLELIRAKQEAEAEALAERAAHIVDTHVPATTAAGVAATDGERRAWTIDVERVERDGSDRLARQTSVGSTHAHTAGAGHHHPHRLVSQSKLNPMYRSKYRMFQTDHSISQERASRRSSSAASGEDTTASKHAVAGSLRPIPAPTIEAAAEAAAASVKAATSLPEGAGEEEEEQFGGYFEEIYTMPAGVLPKVWFFFTRPIVVATRLTIPDCRFPRFSGALGFTATFVLSIAWIAVLSHYTVVWATRFGCIAGIPSALMGLTILAAGTSVPDAMSSVLVARDGHGDMAVSNALGSNVFDILFGLGLPFLLSNLVYGEPVVVLTDDLEVSVIILFAVLVTVVGLLLLTKWRLRRSVGAFMIVLYAAYVVFSYARGMGWI